MIFPTIFSFPIFNKDFLTNPYKMKKEAFVLSVLLMSLNFVTSQDWITLKTPQSGILGAPVKSIKNNDINFNFALKYDKTPALDLRDGPKSSIEYENKFRDFTTKYFNAEKVSIRNINAYSLKIRSLSQESIDELQIGGKYVYEGIAADSVTITVSAKRDFSADISAVVNDLASIITNPSTTKIIEKVAPVLDSIRYVRNDSIHYKITVQNPNVYYKVKIIKLKKVGNPCNCDWEKNCFLYFVNKKNNDFPRTIRLENDFSNEKSTTISRYPEFCGKDRKDVQYYLKVEKEKDSGLLLNVYATSANVNNSAKKVLEVPYKNENGKRTYRLDRTFLYRLIEKGRIKNVFIEVSAKQVDDNSIDIINWREGTNSMGNNALTSLKYPEFKGKYVKR